MNKDKIIGIMAIMLLIGMIIIVRDYVNGKKQTPGVIMPQSVTQPNAAPAANDNQSRQQPVKFKVKDSFAASNNVDPKIYMPLAVGNSWTYIWKNKVVSNSNEPEETRKPTIFCLLFLEKEDKTNLAFGSIFVYEPKIFRDTYTIERQEKDSFIFEISCAGDGCEYHKSSDSRYGESIENSWTWWSDSIEPGEVHTVLLEKTKKHLSASPGSADEPLYEDGRNVIHVTKRNNVWGIVGMIYSYGKRFKIDYDFSDYTVEVPAGKFEHCIKVKEIYITEFKDRDLTYTVHKYYAPNVGKVKEFQELEDGTVTYTMELESYKVAK